jgi:methionyl-tRNA formyltransferase
MPLRIIFMGTPDFSVPTLLSLRGAGHDIVACYTQPPRPAGRRGLELVKSPVQQAAEDLGVAVYTPLSLKGEREQEDFRSHSADVAVVVAYGLLLPQAILDAPKLGCFNGHASLLPRWRGAAPIQRALMAGDAETGVMVMKMEAGLDTGPVALATRLPIETGASAGDLHDSLSRAGAALMVDAMAKLETGVLTTTPQSDEGVTYASKIKKSESRIDWSAPGPQVQCHIMGLSPFPGAWCEMKFGERQERVKILRADNSASQGPPGTLIDDQLTVACGTVSVQLLQLQRAGSKAMAREAFLRGHPMPSGIVLL